VCNFTAGTCASSNALLYVTPTGSPVTSCGQADPCTISRAFALATSTRNIVTLSPGTYTDGVTFSNKSVVVHGFGSTLNAAASAHAFSVSDGATLTVYGLSIVDLNSSNAGVAIDCEPSSTSTPPTLNLDQVSIDAATNNAIFGYPCTVTVTRSHLHERTSTVQVFMGIAGTIATFDRTLFDGGDGIVSAGGGVTHITNSVIVNQTGPDGAFLGGSVLGSPMGSMFVSFSTVINSAVKCSTGTPACRGGTAAGSCVDNTLIFNAAPGAPADTVTGSACNASYSLVYPQSSAIAGSNNTLGINPALVNVSNADYHLAAGSPAINTADPSATNGHDYDGTSRPQGGRDDIGAFEYKP